MTVKLCACGCGRPLIRRDNRARYFEDSCRYKAAQKRRSPVRPFVALDGEGETKASGIHVYTLLASGNGKDIGRKKGLSTEECLNFLLDLPRGSNSGSKPIYIWFSFDYDVNMILGDLGEDDIARLRAENTIFWRGYRITYLRRKILRLARGTRRHTSYDIWGFFQSTFEGSLQAWNVFSDPIIQKGKASRSGFRNWSLASIRAYNQAELKALEELAEKLRDSITPLELPIQSWHGPAALAGAWLRKNHAKEWIATDDLPESFSKVVSQGYFGGRIDVLGYGFTSPVWHYDIVSAYPSATRNVPNLRKLKWKALKKLPETDSLYIARVQWDISDNYWCPFPWRAKNGSIRYPTVGEGWYWKPEIETAFQKYGRDKIKVKEVWIAEGEYQYPFQNLIQETFEYRGELKRKNHPSHIPIKLILNSLYGKFAQTVGKASYYSPIWAGLITSETRAKLMLVLDENVRCVMTDSIWSSKPLPIDIGTQLGDWEQQEDNQLSLAEAGLYSATKPDGSKHVWQRGFDKRNPVDIDNLVNNWLYQDPTFQPQYIVNRFVGMGLASMTSYPWRQWIDIPREIQPVPIVGTTKRLPFYPSKQGKDLGDFIQLLPRPRDTDTISAPYSKITFDESLIIERLQDECED